MVFNPFFIAEMSANHNGSLVRAIEIIKSAKQHKASAVKIQIFNADDMTLNDGQRPKNQLWSDKTYYQIYQEGAIPENWLPTLFSVAADEGIDLFPSVFSKRGVDVAEGFNPKFYKISSFELDWLDLIRYAASTNKHMILSTGLASREQIEGAAIVCEQAAPSFKDVTVLHCVSEYPTKLENCNLDRLYNLRSRFSRIGISSHSTDFRVPIIAATIGASVFEVHYTLDHEKTLDSEFSYQPEQFEEMVDNVNTTIQIIGNCSPPIIGETSARRSVYAVKDIMPGEEITNLNTAVLRPFAEGSLSINGVAGFAKVKISKNSPVLTDYLI